MAKPKVQPHPEAKVFAATLAAQAMEVKDLERINLELNVMRVNIWQSLLTERDELSARIRRIEERIRILRMDPLAQTNEERKL